MTVPLFASATDVSPPRVLVIAEVGVNHDGQLARAVELVEAAASAGADAVKFQSFHPDRLLSKQAMLAAYQASAAGDARELLAGLALTADEMKTVRGEAARVGLRFILTPFSLADVDDARPLELDAVKIASPDAVNAPLLRAAAGLGTAMLISTGASELRELGPAAELLGRHRPGGCLLQCVSSYPAPGDLASLGGMAALADAFGLPVGYSDHTADPLTGALAVAAGAVVIEKHLTYDTAAAGPDHAASLDPEGFSEYVRLVRKATAMMGPRAKRLLPIERDVRAVSRQSVCAARDLPAGRRLREGDLTLKRPGTGIPAADLDATLGRTLTGSVEANHLLQPGDLEG